MSQINKLEIRLMCFAFCLAALPWTVVADEPLAVQEGYSVEDSAFEIAKQTFKTEKSVVPNFGQLVTDDMPVEQKVSQIYKQPFEIAHEKDLFRFLSEAAAPAKVAEAKKLMRQRVAARTEEDDAALIATRTESTSEPEKIKLMKTLIKRERTRSVEFSEQLRSLLDPPEETMLAMLTIKHFNLSSLAFPLVSQFVGVTDKDLDSIRQGLEEMNRNSFRVHNGEIFNDAMSKKNAGIYAGILDKLNHDQLHRFFSTTGQLRQGEDLMQLVHKLPSEYKPVVQKVIQKKVSEERERD